MDRPGRVRVDVYDMAGRRVAVIADDYFAPKHQLLIWDATQMPADNYIIQALHSQRFIRKTVTLLK